MGRLTRLLLSRDWGDGIKIQVNGQEASVEIQHTPGGRGNPIRLVIHAPAEWRVTRLELGPIDPRLLPVCRPCAPESLSPKSAKALERWEQRKRRLGLG
jgi:sRNA-binding carbon storage regulator CsrA